MKLFPRRALGLFLSAALVGGMIPPQAARAAGLAVEAGAEAGAPGGAAVAAPIGVLQVSPATLIAPVSLAGSLSVSAAPAAFTAAPALSAAAADGPAALPTAAPQTAVAPDAAPALSAAAAPTDERASDGPQASAAAPAARSWLSRARGFLSRRDSRAEADRRDEESMRLFLVAWGLLPSDRAGAAITSARASAKAEADRLFDGTAASADASASVAAPRARLIPRLAGRLSRWTNRRASAYRARRALTHDDFGGPKTAPMSFGRKLGYGAKWGLNLIGINAVLNLTLAPLLSRFSWPLLFSGAGLERIGRVELLTKFGPHQISAALSTHPAAFLGLQLPLSTGMEELTYRFLGFGLLFGALALAKPVTTLAARLLGQVPDASGLNSTAQRVLRGAGRLVSYYAFPVAAAASAFAFAVAHFGAWGIDPLVFAVNLAAGLVLARVAYKTRGLTAPFVAHMVFNLSALGAGVLAFSLGMPGAALIYSVLASITGIVALWYNWRSSRQERAFALKGLKSGAVGLMLAALVGGSMLGLPADRGGATLLSARVPVAALVDKAVASVPAVSGAAAAPQLIAPAAPDDSAVAIEDPADLVARVKPTVVEVIVTIPGGYALGSGVIISDDGRIVTNAHVVDAHGVGELVTVVLINGQKVKAKILAVNHDRDLAFLQLPALKGGMAWPSSPFAATAPREGDDVYAMGHPLGLPFTVTKGIVSGLGSRGNMYVQYLQTDASITHGNSGGPLFNDRGEVLGINTMGPENAGSIGFSIIAPGIERALAQYDQTGNINTAALGVITDLSNPEQPDHGIVIEAVRPGSAAAKAGLISGDVIVGVEGNQLKSAGGQPSANELAALLAQSKPGDVVHVSVLRGDSVKTVSVKLGAKATSEATSGAHSLGGPDTP